MAAAQGTVRFRGRNSGRTYAINFYASDAANVAVKFDESKIAVAGSPDSWTAKEPSDLVDIAFTSDLATPTAVQLLVNGTPTGDILDVTAQLISVTVRPNASLALGAGQKFGMTQIA